MKDRFVKIMLVIIAGLLFLNCFNNIPPKAEASIPAFFQVGKSYECSGLGGPSGGISEKNYGEKITEIDSNSGWVEKEGKLGKIWINTTNLLSCEESNPQTK